MSPRVRRQVRQRAGGRCEYCHLPEAVAELHFQVDHVVAQKHGGGSGIVNLAWACFRCNTHKGPNLAGKDRRTRRVLRLFNPRTDAWKDHFRWSGPTLIGKTGIGRVTVDVLCINRPDALLLRRSLMAEGTGF